MRSRVDRSFWKPELMKLVYRSGWSMPIWQPPGTHLSPTEFFSDAVNTRKASSMDLGLKGCKASIAGASKGLGKACAKALADEGARVFICARDKVELKRAAAELGA